MSEDIVLCYRHGEEFSCLNCAAGFIDMDPAGGPWVAVYAEDQIDPETICCACDGKVCDDV